MKLHNDITFLVGNKDINNLPFEPYNHLVCEFLNDLSRELRAVEESSNYPDIITFSFWCRKGNISHMKKELWKNEMRMGLGLVFHITPSNVPINFAYSFVFGLLSGNANIIRVPSKLFPQIDIICSAIGRLFGFDKYKEIKLMNAFIRYNKNKSITDYLSANCNARIIWGGDTTIRNIRKSRIKERCVDIAFADRYSICIIETSSIIELDKVGLTELAEKFYNDTYLMDQNACSSPHLIIWKGKDPEKAKSRFWDTLSVVVKNKYELPLKNSVDKYTSLCNDVIMHDNISNFKKHSNFIYRLNLNEIQNKMDELRGKFGYFYEYNIHDTNSIADIINNKYQSLTYFGIKKSNLLNLIIKNRLLGIDRIVPVGKALEMNIIWDGYDIIRTLSRIIEVK